jgi:nitrate reductase cytochrome c-type subunit
MRELTNIELADVSGGLTTAEVLKMIASGNPITAIVYQMGEDAYTIFNASAKISGIEQARKDFATTPPYIEPSKDYIYTNPNGTCMQCHDYDVFYWGNCPVYNPPK